MCRSACFGRLHAHHQELTGPLTASGLTLEHGGNSVVGRGLAGILPTCGNPCAFSPVPKKKKWGAEKHPPKSGPTRVSCPFFSLILFSKEGAVAGRKFSCPFWVWFRRITHLSVGWWWSVCWCLESVVKAFGTTVKKASKKVVETCIFVWCHEWRFKKRFILNEWFCWTYI
jgi:hypothetical protein